jgi:hypothetical protein
MLESTNHKSSLSLPTHEYKDLSLLVIFLIVWGRGGHLKVNLVHKKTQKKASDWSFSLKFLDKSSLSLPSYEEFDPK